MDCDIAFPLLRRMEMAQIPKYKLHTSLTSIAQRGVWWNKSLWIPTLDNASDGRFD